MNALTTRPPRISYKWGTFVDIYQNFQEKIANFQYKLGSTAILFYKQGFKNKRLPISCTRVRHVSPTPADLGGVTSFLYELEPRYKLSSLMLTII